MTVIRWQVRVLVALVAFAPTGRAAPQFPPMPDPTRFEKTVAAYEAADKTSPPPKGAILFVGDSQFYRWKTLPDDLPEYTIVNRGIDSFHLSDLLYYADRLVLPYAPRLIVLHVGGNDIHNGRASEAVAYDFVKFVQKVRAAQPGVPIAFTSITPSPGRWGEAETRIKANTDVKNYVAREKGLHFIDLWDAMLGPDGQPREDLWVEDRIHPNHDGYLLRVKIMRPLLGPPDKE
jgi:lysophospholipase L1-like esterase